MKVARKVFIILLALTLIVSCSKKDSEETSEEEREPEITNPKEILKKTLEKYGNLAQKGINSIDAKLEFDFAGAIPRDLGNELDIVGAMMDKIAVKSALELSFVKEPFGVYASMSGDLGRAKLYISGGAYPTLTIVLPDEKQYTEIDMDENDIQEFIDGMDDAQEELKGEDISAAVDDLLDEMFESDDVEITRMDSMERTKLGRAHKIVFTPSADEDLKGQAELYIVDREWIPARFDFDFTYQELQYSYSPYSPYSSRRQTGTSTKTAKGSVEFEKLKINSRISGEKFEPNTRGYKELDEEELSETMMKRMQSIMKDK